MDFGQKIYLLKAKLAYLATPSQRRVYIDIQGEGRHITFLLASLHELNFALHVSSSPVLYYNLMLLKNHYPINFISGDSAVKCDWVITDSKASLQKAPAAKAIIIDYDYFSRGRQALMPYFMHPTIYHKGLLKTKGLADAKANAANFKRSRIGFFGTKDPDFYTSHFNFDLLNRETILNTIINHFESMIFRLENLDGLRKEHKIAFALDDKGGDNSAKLFLPQKDYLFALSLVDFFVSPPGWCMPFSHNLIEGMALGSIPILNYADYLDPELQHGVNCLYFSTQEELIAVMNQALIMPAAEINRMKENVAKYYRKNLKAGSWLSLIMKEAKEGKASIVSVNNEEVSVAKLFPSVLEK